MKILRCTRNPRGWIVQARDRVRDCVAGGTAPTPFVVDRNLVHLDARGPW
jgi:hypothetical protein